MATTLSHFPQSSSPSNSWLPPSDAYANMAETTMAPADLALAERSMPVGCRFHPTDQELVGHYLGHKLRADDPFIHDTIPEFGLCKGEPWDLLEWATSASAVKFDESQCYFFSPRDRKYSNSTRSNRATLGGFWKLTGRDRKITSKGTNKVIGTKKTLVYYEGRVPRAIKTNWITHEYEYHDDKLSHDQRSHVLCWLRKDNEKKTKQKTHQLVDDYGSQAIICMNSDEHCMSSMIQGSSESSEVIDSMIQMPFGSNEAVESMIQVSSQSNRTIDSMIQIPFESNEVIDSLIELSSQSNGAIDPMIQILFESNEVVDSSQSNEAIDSMIQKLFESDEVVDSMIQVSSQTHEIINQSKQISPQSYEAIGSMIQTPFKSNEKLTSIIQTPLSESNSTIELDSIIQTPLSESNSTIELDSIIQTPFKCNEELASIIHTPLSESNSTVAVDSMIQPHFERGEELASIIHTLPHESNSTMTVDLMIQTSIKPTIQPEESLSSMIHILLPPEPNSTVETSFDAGELGEFGFSLFDCDSGEFDFISLLQSPRIEEQGLFDGNI